MTEAQERQTQIDAINDELDLLTNARRRVARIQELQEHLRLLSEGEQ